METLKITPRSFLWSVENPEDYWADTFKEIKCIVHVNGQKLGGFYGVNASFDDDTFYVNYYDEDGNFHYCSVPSTAEMLLVPIQT